MICSKYLMNYLPFQSWEIKYAQFICHWRRNQLSTISGISNLAWSITKVLGESFESVFHDMVSREAILVKIKKQWICYEIEDILEEFYINPVVEIYWKYCIGIVFFETQLCKTTCIHTNRSLLEKGWWSSWRYLETKISSLASIC